MTDFETIGACRAAREAVSACATAYKAQRRAGRLDPERSPEAAALRDELREAADQFGRLLLELTPSVDEGPDVEERMEEVRDARSW